jgi:hypothetical protein
MLRLDRFIRSTMTVGDVKTRYPHTTVIFERFGFRSVSDDCSIELAAKHQGLRTSEIVDALNWTLVPNEGYRE